jgi:hypothetical protein
MKCFFRDQSGQEWCEELDAEPKRGEKLTYTVVGKTHSQDQSSRFPSGTTFLVVRLDKAPQET